MKYAFLWRAFLETGDPMCYLFYKIGMRNNSNSEFGMRNKQVWSKNGK